MNKKLKSHKDLMIWQKSMNLVDVTYNLTRSFPSDERFGLTNQMRRSAVSVPSNIAEGAARESKKEFSHFLSISLGSLSELETQFLIAERQKYITGINSILSNILEIKRMIKGLRNKLIIPPPLTKRSGFTNPPPGGLLTKRSDLTYLLSPQLRPVNHIFFLENAL